MSSPEYNRNTTPDILQLNMESISKELNELIVTCEHEQGITQQFHMGTVKTTAQSFMTMAAPSLANNFQYSAYAPSHFYKQQQHYGRKSVGNSRYNFNYNPVFQQPMTFGCVNNTANNLGETLNILNPPNYLCGAEYLNNSSHNLIQSPLANVAATPSYEFHYLQPHGEFGRKYSATVSSCGGQGAFRKIAKQPQRNFNPIVQNGSSSKEDTKFDLSTLDFEGIDKETSTVRHLFDLFRDLHCAIAETPPSFEVNTDSQYEETFASDVTRKSVMPSTLNVQIQVKQACRKLTIFTYEMQRILAGCKIFDNEMHTECEFYLNQLRQYLNRLEMYKRVVMEHKNGKFLRDEVKVDAESLSLLLEHTNRQIREVHIRILAVDWYFGVKYRGGVHVSATQFNAVNNKEISHKSKIGVINEILEMCNTTATTSTSAAAIAETTKAQTEATNPTDTINSLTKFMNNQETVNVLPPPLNKTNDIFNIYKPDQAKRMSNISTSSHNRHPVFYIG